MKFFICDTTPNPQTYIVAFTRPRHQQGPGIAAGVAVQNVEG